MSLGSGISQLGIATAEIYTSVSLIFETRCIRVIDLEKAPSSNASAPLRGRLRVISLDDNPSFAALSYVWGGAPDTGHTITCYDGIGKHADIQITLNCDQALRRIRTTIGAVRIWVDAICINQQDVLEKQHQIPLMLDIYSQARPVYIWLGQGTQKSDRAMDFITTVSRYHLTFRHLELLGVSSPISRIVKTMKLFMDMALLNLRAIGVFLREFMVLMSRLCYFVLSSDCICGAPLPSDIFFGIDAFDVKPDPEVVACLGELLTCEWSRRVWTFQEFMLGQNIKLICGHKVVNWEDLIRCLWDIRQYSDWLSGTYYTTWCDLIIAWLNLPRVQHHKKRFFSRSETKQLLSLLELTQRRKVETNILTYLSTAFASLVFISFTLGFPLIIAAIVMSWNSKEAKKIVPFFVPWGIFSLVISLCFTHIMLRRRGATLTGDYKYFTGRIRHEARMDLWRGAMLRSSENPATLAQKAILTTMRESQTTDAKDRSYALRGVLERLGVGLPPVDYTKSTEKVYQELFISLLAWQPQLLRLIIDSGRLPNSAPLWVPNFDGSRTLVDLSYCLGTNTEDATKGSSPHLGIVGDQLLVKGMLHDNLQYTSELLVAMPRTLLSSETQLNHNVSVFLHWISAVRRDVIMVESYQSISDAIYRCIKGKNDVNTTSLGSGNFNHWYKLFIAGGMINDLISKSRVGQVVKQLMADDRALKHFRECCNALCLDERRFFITSKGYIGSGPAGILAGDSCSLISGVPVPLLLRSSGEPSPTYEVVGPAYVHGLMQGEEWREDGLLDLVLA